MPQMIRNAVLAAGLAATTALSLPASAAPAAPPQVFAASRFDPADTVADQWRCRWNCGWGGGWGRGRGWGWDRGWRRNRVDAGDVILGAVLIGGIAAIASSALRRERDRDRDVIVYDRVPDRRDGEWVRRDARPTRPVGATSGAMASGLDNAAALCVDAVERDARVESVDNVRRDASGWEVTGALARGQGFRCRIGNDGRIAAIDLGDGAAVGSSADGQWSGDAYAAARQEIGGTVRPDIAVQETTMTAPVTMPRRAAAAQAMPAYPGGPIPGEDIPEDAPEGAGGW